MKQNKWSYQVQPDSKLRFNLMSHSMEVCVLINTPMSQHLIVQLDLKSIRFDWSSYSN